LEKGLPYSVIQELELSDYEDWKAAATAIDLDKKLVNMNITIHPLKTNQAREADFNRIKNEQMLCFGFDPYKVNAETIKKSKERLRQSGKVHKVGNNKRNTGKT
jgi:hypothetical protein